MTSSSVMLPKLDMSFPAQSAYRFLFCPRQERPSGLSERGMSERREDIRINFVLSEYFIDRWANYGHR